MGSNHLKILNKTKKWFFESFCLLWLKVSRNLKQIPLNPKTDIFTSGKALFLWNLVFEPCSRHVFLLSLGETCSNDRKYYLGCDRKCSDGSDYICPTKKAGCWCPEGHAENENGECIKIGNCPCRSGKVFYQVYFMFNFCKNTNITKIINRLSQPNKTCE